VLADLEKIGYDAWPFVVGAWAVGAPHRRDRVWIVARRLDDAAEPRLAGQPRSGAARALRDGARREEPSGSRRGCAGLDSEGRLADAGGRATVESGRPESGAGTALARGLGASVADAGQPPLAQPRDAGARRWPARPGEPQHEWEAPRLVEFAVGSSVAGISPNVVRARRRNNREALRAYGNAVVPDCAEAVLRAMLEQEAP
jgi:DNA (cytosine-5)-methyltransferase 1